MYTSVEPFFSRCYANFSSVLSASESHLNSHANGILTLVRLVENPEYSTVCASRHIRMCVCARFRKTHSNCLRAKPQFHCLGNKIRFAHNLAVQSVFRRNKQFCKTFLALSDGEFKFCVERYFTKNVSNLLEKCFA